jgi:hypothetical protein
MAGYSSTPLWKKPGLRAEIEAAIDGAPVGYLQHLQLPPEMTIRWVPEPRKRVWFVHLFCKKAPVLKKKLTRLRKLIPPDGVIWVSWPKKASGVQTDLTEDIVRSSALPLGLVDIKVCAVDEIWSGLKLMIRKSER